MKKQTKFLVATSFSVSIIIWLIFYSYTKADIVTYSFLEDIPCPLPCWENITPGTTSELDALKILITQKLFSPDSSNYFQDNKFHFVTPSKDAVSITFANGQVERITLNHDKSLPLSAMIDKLGEP